MGNEEDRVNGRAAGGAAGIEVGLEVKPERRLIRPSGSRRHIVFHIRVGESPAGAGAERKPLTLGLVLDRSGSMAGGKLDTAKRATLAVLDRLGERDRVAVVVFDDRVDLLQGLAPATADVKARIRAALDRTEARASTALHEGWLTGCQAIAADQASGGDRGLCRCFLLTDGLANVGLTDPERIASEAASVRDVAGVSTSTFGIGPDYAEGLLGPMAVAGGGQFHHLREAREITSTFVGELGDMLEAAARDVRLEVEMGEGLEAEVVSAYRASTRQGAGRLSLNIGDLLAREERILVVRFRFPRGGVEEAQAVRARVAWADDSGSHGTQWQEACFTYASHQACDAEARDPWVMHWVGLHHAERARREATERNRRGDLAGARNLLRTVAQKISAYAGQDQELRDLVRDLESLSHEVAEAPISAMLAKETYYESQRRSRGQRDHREP